jgi:hypothetical protein
MRSIGIVLVVAAMLQAGADAASGDDEPAIRALLVLGGCCHDYQRQQILLTKGISERAPVAWTIAYDPDSSTGHPNPVYLTPGWSAGYDVVVHDECSADVTLKAFVDTILAPHRKGLPAVNLHCATHSYRVSGSDDWFAFTGLTTHSHGAQLPIELSFVDAANPILVGLSPWTTMREELYHNEKVWGTVTPLIRGRQGADDDLVAWTNDYQGTRVFSTTLGHNDETVRDARYLDLVARGLLWAVGKLDARHFHPPVILPNLALGKTATASSTQDDHAPEKAIDGNAATRWCASDGSVPQWWQCDLGAPADLGGVQITWEQSAVYRYLVKGSPDAEHWTTLADASASTVSEQVCEHAFSASGIRYLRIEVVQLEEGKWASIYEVEVHARQ